MKLRLIPEWRRAWRFASVWAAALLALLSMLQAEVLPLLQAAIEPTWWPWISAGFAAAIVLLRLVAQPGALGQGTEAAPERRPTDDGPEREAP